MPIDVSHFTMVGFALNLGEQAAFMQSAVNIAGHCPLTNLNTMDMICRVSDPSGAELRIGLQRDANGRSNIVTMNPAYRGEGRARLSIDSDISDPDEKPFEITLSAHFTGEQTPVVFELADPLSTSKAIRGRDAVMDIAAFSFKPDVFADEASYMASQKSEKVQFAPNVFIPSGMFFVKVGGAMPDDSTTPTAYADFAGEILKCELKTNTAGGGQFWWALVKTYGSSTIDVVLDPTTVTSGLKAGEIIRGRFWLSAEIVEN